MRSALSPAWLVVVAPFPALAVLGLLRLVVG